MRRRTHGGTLAWVISIPSLEQEVWAPLPQVLMVLDTITTGFHLVSTFGTTMNYQIWDNHELSTSYCY